MKLLCDENVKHSAVHILRQEGNDVARVQEALDLECSDEGIVDHCRRTRRLLMTIDDDLFEFEDHPGILFLDDQRASPREIAIAVRRIERHVGSDALANDVFHVPDGWIWTFHVPIGRI